MPSSHPLALITNDDGIDSAGLHALARGAADAGYDVVVAAPSIDASGTGGSVRSVTEDGHVPVAEHDLPGLDGVPAYAVAGHPAYIVNAAGRGWLDREADVVLSGINYGSNTGRQILHSGTVGAVLAGAHHGWSGLAISLNCGLSRPEAPHWDAVLGLLPDLLDRLRARPSGTAWNLNVPDVAFTDLPELREATLAGSGAVQVRMTHRTADGVRPGGLHTLVTETWEHGEPGSDVALLGAGHPVVTEISQLGSRPGAIFG
ncbi:5'-nucleotidase [Pseudonocardia sediminis]|uniref:5'-nucleotidase n=1 Tax=Pseudonocardia sediminis TaxID=1397368 RepID=A0A4Q7V2Q0_PSEST|nr:5'/3'-nucleotidase SurE [Pseudonocardia sediminis]RZT88857.1 5'-nucleotidase [Pseudonocardia sediminis]